MASGSSGTQTSVQKSDPWSGQQPYLTDLFSGAQQQFNNGAEYFPGSTVVPFSPDTLAGMDAIRANASGDAGAGDAQALVKRIMAGGGATGTGGPGGNPVWQRISDFAGRVGQAGQGALAAAALGGMAVDPSGVAAAGGAPNAYMSSIGGAGSATTGGIGAVRDASGREITAGNDVLQRIASGSEITGNPMLDATFNKAASQVRDNTNAAFSLAGRYGSGAHSKTMGDTLGNLATSIYGGAYENERGRQMQAVGELGNRQASDIATRLSGASTAAGLEQNDLGRNLSAQGLLGQLADSGLARNLSAAGQVAGLTADNYGRQINAAGTQAGLEQNDLARNAGLLGQLADYDLSQTGQGLQAANMLGGLRDLSNAGGRDLLNLGNMQEGQASQELDDLLARWNFSQQAPWDALGKYGAVIGGMGNLGGTTTSTSPRASSGGLLGGLSGAAAGAGISSALSLTGPVGWGVAGLGGLLGLFG